MWFYRRKVRIPWTAIKNKPRFFADGKSEKVDDDVNKKQAARLPGPHTERKRPGERLPSRHGGRKKSERMAEEQFQGWK